MSSLLEEIKRIAVFAGDEAAKFANLDKKTQVKGDGSPVTAADMRSHQIIKEELNKLEEKIPIISEEGEIPSFAKRKKWKKVWVVDPLDGTKEFLKGNGEFTVNIALIDSGEPILGVVYTPEKKTLYYASRGQGAFKETKMGIEKLPLKKDLNSPLTVALSRSHNPEKNRVFLDEVQSHYSELNFVKVGSSLKFCLLAEGVIDLYPRLGPIMEWDSAAAHIIVEEAGCFLWKFTKDEPLEYNKERMTNPWFIAFKPKLKEMISNDITRTSPE